MRTRLSTAVLAVALVFSAMPLASCRQIAGLKAKMAFKDANVAYQANDYRKAAAKYEEAISRDPNFTDAYFYLANSYDNLFKPAKKGEATNDALSDQGDRELQEGWRAVQQSEAEEAGPRVSGGGLSRQARRPGQAEPVVQRMIQMEPNEPTNYFALAKIYEDAGQLRRGRGHAHKANDIRPNDPTVYMQLAGYYNRQGEFDKTIDALQQRAAKEPTNPEAFHTLATYFWDKCFRD